MSQVSARRTDYNAVAATRPSLVHIPKAAEIVSRELRNQIIRGEIKAGESLTPEGELMTRFGVSRPTLREAIRILESEGLISISRGARGGATVHPPSFDVGTRHVSLLLQASGTTLSDIYKVHMLVEPAAARHVAENCSKTAPAILRACIMEGVQHFDSDFDFGVAAARFRNKLIELAEIHTLTLLMGMLNNIFERYWSAATVAAGQQIDTAPSKRKGMRSLEKLIVLIEAGDGPGAEAHWRQHTRAVERMMDGWLPAAKVIDLLDDY